MDPDTATIDSIPSIENILKVDELSEDEFKTQIIKWFKDRGLLANMRTYMRYQMITYLKETQIGNALAEKSVQPILPKERTIHFLIAEYLLHNQYYYSLSILVSEVSFLNVFPDMTAIKKSNTCLTKQLDEQLKFRFDENDLIEFIQSLGIFQNSLEAEQICKFYLKSSNYSLLSIILRVLTERTLITSESSNKSVDLEMTNENKTIYVKWNNMVYTILKKALFKSSNIYLIRDNIVHFFMNEFDKFQNDTELKQKIEFDKMKDAIENEFECKKMHLKKNLMEMEQKFNKEMNFYIQTLTSKDEIIGKLRSELKKFENFNEHIQKLKQKYTKEEESKKRYKETAQLLKHECLKLQDQLIASKEEASKKDSNILSLNETIRTLQEDFDNKLKLYDKEINDLKLENNKLKEELDQEKTSAILTQVKHQEEISRNNSLLVEITDLKTKNQTLETYLNELNKRSDELNRQFQNTMKSLQTIDQNKIFESETQHKKSNIKLDEKNFMSESESVSPSNSIIDILNETKQRLDNLQIESQLIQDNYNKYCVKTPIRYFDLWRTTRMVANQNVSTNTIDQPETLNNETFTEFDHRIKLKNETTCDAKVNTEDELETLPDQPQFGVSKLPPLFEELHTNILSSFHNFQSTVLEVSRDLNMFVQNTSKLSDNLIKPQQIKYNLQQEYKTNLKAKELESNFFELDDMENNIMNSFIANIDPLPKKEWFPSENDKISQKSPSIQTFKSINSNFLKLDPSVNSDSVQSENERILQKSSSAQTFNSIKCNESKSIQTINHPYFLNCDNQINLKNLPNQNSDEVKLGVYETSSMEFIYEQAQESSQLKTDEETEKVNDNIIEIQNNNEVKEIKSEYVIEPLEMLLPPLECDADNNGEKRKNYSSSIHSERKICPLHSEIDQLCNSKCTNNDHGHINESLNNKHETDSINSQLTDQEEIKDINSHSLQNIIETLVNKVYSSTDDIVSFIDDKNKERQNSDQLVHILEQISVEDITNNKSSNSNSLNSPVSTGFDNKNDDFWM